MMSPFTHPAARAVLAVTLLGSALLARPLLAASGNLALAAVKPAPADPVEARIKALHSKFHITATQETLWSNVTQVMRDNAKAMQDLRKDRAKNEESMSAMDELKSYAAGIEAHETGLQKFIPVFQALYDGMSDTQKKAADIEFRKHARAEMQKGK
jgi:hypothetical protein